MEHTQDKHGPVRLFLTPAGEGQLYITASLSAQAGDPSTAAALAYGLIADVLSEQGLAIVHERIHGSIASQLAVLAGRAKALSTAGIPAGPHTYIQGGPAWGEGLAGINIQAVTAKDTWDISHEGQVVGRGFKRDSQTFLMLQNMHGLINPGDSRGDQTTAMLELTECILQANDASYRNVIRTWIYIHELLDWYDEFNVRRSEKYAQFGLMPAPGQQRISLPSSTGIEGATPVSAACAMDVLAVVGDAEIEQMTNARQEDAFLYGSAFSRAAHIKQADVETLLLSGTASIDEDGVSVHVDDTRKQIVRTFENVKALIAQKGMTLQHICDANLFIKRAEDANLYREVAAELGLSDLPGILINTDVCRDDLLFEIDATVVKPL